MKYANIVFIQSSDETEEPEQIYNEQGIGALFEYLKQWDYGKESEQDIYDGIPWGTNDEVYPCADNYILTINTRMPYFGLCRIIKD
jgi:hypothetical protein